MAAAKGSFASLDKSNQTSTFPLIITLSWDGIWISPRIPAATAKREVYYYVNRCNFPTNVYFSGISETHTIFKLSWWNPGEVIRFYTQLFLFFPAPLGSHVKPLWFTGWPTFFRYPNLNNARVSRLAFSISSNHIKFNTLHSFVLSVHCVVF